MKIKDLSEKTVNELSPETRKSYLLKAAPLNRANPTAKRSKGINRALLGPSKTDDQNVNETHDQSTEARELFLFAENDSDLYRTSFLPIVKNLEKKFKKGTYDKALAAKLWKYHADRAAKKYGIEHGSVDGFKIFSPSVRREVAEKFATDHFIEMDAGNFHDAVNEQDMEEGMWDKVKDFGKEVAYVGRMLMPPSSSSGGSTSGHTWGKGQATPGGPLGPIARYQNMKKNEGIAEDSTVTKIFSGLGSYMQKRAPVAFKKLGITVISQNYDEDEDIQEYTVKGTVDAIKKAQEYLENEKYFGGVYSPDNLPIMEDSDAVIGAITQRIVLSHPELLRHGPEAVMDAINDVAHSVGQVDEIGTSDVSGWVKQVAEILRTGTPNLSESKKTNKKKIK